MDEQHGGLCLPLSLAGTLLLPISLVMFIYVQISVSNITAVHAVHS